MTNRTERANMPRRRDYRRRPVIAAVLFAALGLARAQDAGTRDWQFLVPGSYHGGEAPAEPGQGWLALDVVGGRWHLVPAKVRAERVHDPVTDGSEDEKTGILVASDRPAALVLLRLPRLRAGKVDTPDMKFRGPPRALRQGAALDIAFKSERWRLAVENETIVLMRGAQRQPLAGIGVSADQSSDWSHSATLLWAGDLDGDGALDLVIGHETYNNGGTCLYLSSAARAGEPLVPVACQNWSGC